MEPLQDENPAAWYWWVGEVEQFLSVRPSGREQAETAKKLAPRLPPPHNRRLPSPARRHPRRVEGRTAACRGFVVVREAGGSGHGKSLPCFGKIRPTHVTLETGTDGLTVLGSPALASRRLEDAALSTTGLALPNLEHWFRCVINDASEDQPFVVGPGLGGPSWPTVRGMVAHAYLIVGRTWIP